MACRTPWTTFSTFCISSWSSWPQILKLLACSYWFQSPLWQWAILCISDLPRRLWATSFLSVVPMKKKLQMKTNLTHLLCKNSVAAAPVTRLWRACVLILYCRIPINACIFFWFYHSCALRAKSAKVNWLFPLTFRHGKKKGREKEKVGVHMESI